MSDQKTATLWCHTAYPVVEKVREWLQASSEWTLKEITTPIQLVSVRDASAVLEGCDAVCLFIPTGDLAVAASLTQTFLSAVQVAGVPRLVWVAPVGSDNDIGRGLARAASDVQAHEKPAMIVRHGILFSELLHHREEIRSRNTLSLPMGGRALLWAAPQDVAEIVVQGLRGDLEAAHPITIGRRENGEELTLALSQQLADNLEGNRFAERRFQAIDVNQDGNLTRVELTPYMAELGYGPGEIDTILDHADINKDGNIDFDEFTFHRI
ncbi:EF-hand domain-containing protein [Candidatus Entotheonella palauensis]|uniref:EF-hand domain-containing protein n=1 Tax=Candidatus Entotheonella palauensis TaxID=93172 RepID=UPI000B7D243A|nr:EF-hand domain-containing protein [Candidatus Entotheonella palauensis]